MAAAALLAFVAPAAQGTTVSQDFTSSGSWTVPAEATEIDVLVVGGGGGGGGPGAVGGGGGGGAVVVCTGIAVTQGQTVTATVGSGGLAGSLAGSGFTNGTDGGTSSLALGGSSVCHQANGGQGGIGDGTGSYDGGRSGNLRLGGVGATIWGGGGGAGSGAAGGSSSASLGGPYLGGTGGIGVNPASLPSPGLFADSTAFYGGGGGGGAQDPTGVDPFALWNAGIGGVGGGGAGVRRSPYRSPVGGANSGGGGGGGSLSDGIGGDGGSGYVVLRYEPRATNSTPPVVSGSGLVGEAVSTTNGSWNNDPTSYAYGWQRCEDEAGTGCVDIGGATGSTYTVVGADVGKYLRSRVTATNAIGGTTASSSNYLLAREPTPTPPTGKPNLAVSIGGPDRVRAGTPFTVGVRVTNRNSNGATRGGTTTRAAKATSLKTCLKVPGNLFVFEAGEGAKSEGKALCWNRSSLGIGMSVSYKVKLRSSDSLAGRESFRATASATGESGSTASAARSSSVKLVEPRPAPRPRPPTG